MLSPTKFGETKPSKVKSNDIPLTFCSRKHNYEHRITQTDTDLTLFSECAREG